jgi:hypothetical protein
METIKVRKLKWIWAWQDEVEEKWLREMSQKGLHLASVGLAGIYTFIRGEPADYVYRLDYRPNSKTEDREYLQIFKDAGWEQVSDYFSWHYFRKLAVPGETQEIFTDSESRVAKYKRLQVFLIAMLPVFLGGLGLPLWSLEEHSWTLGLRIFGIVILMFYIYALINISLKVRQLKRP